MFGFLYDYLSTKYQKTNLTIRNITFLSRTILTFMSVKIASIEMAFLGFSVLFLLNTGFTPWLTLWAFKPFA